MGLGVRRGFRLFGVLARLLPRLKNQMFDFENFKFVRQNSPHIFRSRPCRRDERMTSSSGRIFCSYRRCAGSYRNCRAVSSRFCDVIL